MKKLALTSLAILLSGCGADTVFNEPSADFNSCIVGTWNKQGSLTEDAYEEVYTFFADGTLQYDVKYKIPFYVGFVIWGAEEEDYLPRYLIARETGAWRYEDGVFYTAYQYSKNLYGPTEEETLAYLDAAATPGVPLESSPQGTSITGTLAHCDEEFFDPALMKKVSEEPLTYKFQSASVSRSLQPYREGSDTLILLEDGTGSFSTEEIRYSTGEVTSRQSAVLDHSYTGGLLNVTTQACDECEPADTLYVDHGHSLTQYGDYFFVRED